MSSSSRWGTWSRRLLWFVALYVAGIVFIGAVALVLRAWLKPA